ncbi:MAG TPA: ChbG/HpnK family deacetylase [Acidimicrobiales bacterium]|nr:ChbG/HpnK family deacetylase [Acidimicrobiales bacterium]
MTSLARRLGHPDDARLLIVNCDGLGSSHAANVGSFEALREGLATSARLMLPCPWSREAAGRYRGEDIGVALTLNAEWDLYRWGPLTQSPSLLDGDGGFPRTRAEVWDHADVDEVIRECRTQIERAIMWGFDISHLGSHLSTLALRPEFFDVLVELALDFALPLALPDGAAERTVGFPFRRLAAEEGIVSPDHVITAGDAGARKALERALFDLAPGVTEITARPAVDSPELRALAPDWPARTDDYRLLVDDHDLGALAERAGISLIGYRELRELQRHGG